MKQLDSQIVILKIPASLLKNKNWNYNTSYELARNQGLVATQGDSQLYRMCEEYIPYTRIEEQRKDNKQVTGYRYTESIISLTFSDNKEFDEACEKAKINGKRYKRFVGTTGGVKNDTVLFMREDIYEDMEKRSNNDRDYKKKMVVAKFEAYKALMCSSSIPVSMPSGVIVVKDCIVNFKEDVLYVDDTKTKEPIVEFKSNFDIELNANDGFGIARPSVFEQWSKDIKEDYILSGACLRNFSLKGMCYPFEFEELANAYGIDEVTDVWGKVHKIKEVNLILTESMLKLWDSYKSMEHYLECCKKNGFELCINKIVPEKLEDKRELNYQFLQSFELSDKDIEELVNPTIERIEKALCGDYESTLEFLGANRKTEIGNNINCIDALLTSEKMMEDPYVKRSVYGMIKKKIDGAKIGKIEVEGDFQLASGDPYALVQSMLGVEVTGLLEADEIYSDYWDNNEVEEVLLFRAPMTSHNNIRKVKVSHREECRRWYKYMKRITIVSCKDTITIAENGADFDGDTFFSTNNKVLLKNHKKKPVIMCVQNKADKKVVTEKLLRSSNKNGFSFARGEVVGTVTNRITSQIEVQSRFEEGSEEWTELEKRIICGQLYQQNSIDKLKGVKCNPMPKKWYNDRSCETEFDYNTVADGKPYFMIYIYPSLKAKYTKYIRDCETKARILGSTLNELLIKENPTEEEEEFVKLYHRKMPVGLGNCVMNRICSYVESRFKDINFQINEADRFDYRILRSNVGYSEHQFKKVQEVYKNYLSEVADFRMRSKVEKLDKDESYANKKLFLDHFKREAKKACKNEEVLCNIVLDLCYTKETSKGFAWEISKKQILENLRGNTECLS